MASSFLRFLDHIRRTTVGRTPLDEWSARRRDPYLTTHNTHNRQISIPRWVSNPRHGWRAAADLRLRPRGHWDRHLYIYIYKYINIFYPNVSILALDGGQCSRPCSVCFIPGTNSVIHWISCWMYSTDGLDVFRDERGFCLDRDSNSGACNQQA